MKDKESERIRLHKYYLRHKEEVLQRSKEWVAAHPERRKEISRESARRNYHPGDEGKKQANVARVVAWQKVNREKVAVKNAQWRLMNSEKMREARKKWRLLHRIRTQDLKQANRARAEGAFVEFVERQIVYQNYQGLCGICHQPVALEECHVDHIIPLSKGGLHSYANTQVAHRICNLKKANKVAS